MAVTPQARVNGGAPLTGSVPAAVGNTIQFTAASMATWQAGPVANWKINSFPDGFALPAGWTLDASGAYTFDGNSDPPIFTATPWGCYFLILTVREAGVMVTATIQIDIPSPSGLYEVARGEGAHFGGERMRYVEKDQDNIRVIETQIGAVIAGTSTATPSTIMKRDANADTAVRRLTAEQVQAATTDLTYVAPAAFKHVFKENADDIFHMEDIATLSQLEGRGAGGAHVKSRLADLTLNGFAGLALQVNSLGIISLSATTVRVIVASMTFDVAATIAPTISAGATGKAIEVSGGLAPAGFVGGAATFRGGLGDGAASGKTIFGRDGATPGTNAGGGIDFQGGTAVANLSAGMALLEGATQKIKWGRNDANYTTMRFGTGEVQSGATGLGFGRIEGNAIVINAATSGLYLQETSVTGVAITASNGPVTIQSNSTLTITATATECTGQYSTAPTSIAFSATPTFDCNTSNHHILGAMTANVTALTLSNARAGADYTIKVLQDGTGGRTIVWNANFIFGPTYTNVPSATANAVTVWKFWAESATVWRCIGKETYTA